MSSHREPGEVEGWRNGLLEGEQEVARVRAAAPMLDLSSLWLC